MTDRAKGAVLGALAMIATSVAWVAFVRDKPRDWEDWRLCFEYWLPGGGAAVIGGGIFVGAPCGALVGWFVGALAGRLKRARMAVLVAVALILSLVPTWVTVEVLSAPAYPLGVHAAAASVLAVLVLERLTRRASVIPRAVAVPGHGMAR